MELNKNLNFLASKLVAKAILNIFNDVIYAESSLVEDGFRCSFDFNKNKLSTSSFNAIKKELKKIFDRHEKISYEKISVQNALAIFKSNKYKLEILSEVKTKDVYIIKIGNDFVDLCPNDLNITNLIKPDLIELVNVSGIYWKNDAKNIQLYAIDGWTAKDNDEFKQVQTYLKDKAERDHRKIGAELELFCFDPLVGQGLPIWLENGFNIMFTIENYCRKLLQKYHYHFCQAPILGTTQLYKTSGHWDHYRENMFPPIKVDNEEFVLKPMNCPHHICIYKQKPHSYRELPYRIAEFGIQHRYESSGSLTGLERVRQMVLVDTHTILMQSQIGSEMKRIYDIIIEANKTLGVSFFRVDLSLHDPKDKQKFFDNPQMWANAENQLREVVKSLGVPYQEMIGEAAFYGPKIDLQMKTALGHIITVSTIQLDFLLPERFKLEYINSKGEKERPVFIHASIIGTFERFVASLLEQTKGVLPIWLAPIQVMFIPVNNEKHAAYASKLMQDMLDLDLRARIDDTENRLSYKIRDAQIKKIPYQVVIGDSEMNDSKQMITYREYGKNEEVKLPFKEFIKMIQNKIKNYK